jgi:hypothetical protein
MRGRIIPTVAVFALVAAWAVSGCGNAAASPVYVAEGYANVCLVQCTSNGDSLSGSPTYASLTFQSDKVDSGTLAFTGRQSGSQVSLTLNEALGLTMNIAREPSRPHLKLMFESDNIAMQTLDMAPSSVEDRNAAVARLQGQATGNSN